MPSPALAVATLALVLALGGGAYAAVGGGSETIVACFHHKGGGLYIAHRCARGDKHGLRWNVTGQPGPKGAQGGQGAQGAQGVQGNPAAYPTVLPSGHTETGAFAVRFTAAAASDSGDAEVSFPLPLSIAPTPADNLDDPSACPGTVTAPTATAGNFCFYLGQIHNVSTIHTADPSGNPDVMGTIGGLLTISSTAAGDTIYRGTWAVTAP